MIRLGNRKNITAAGIILLIIWTFISVNTAAFNTEEEFKYFNYIFSYVITVGIGALIALKLDFSDKLYKTISLAVFFLVPFFIMRISVIFAGEPLFTIRGYLGNVALYYMVLAVFFAIFRNMRVSGIVTAVLCYIFNLATFMVDMFRGTPLMPSDLLAVGTAAEVVGNYSFEWQWQMVYTTVILAFVIALLCKFSFKPDIPYRNLLFSSAGAAVAVAVFTVFFFNDFDGVYANDFNQELANNGYGTAYNFFINAKSLRLKEPETYNAEEIEDELSSMEVNYDCGDNKPNVLVIMNESFADLKVSGDFETNEDYMPFFRSLNKNAVKGEVIASTFGGGTCNSEFEFLTGMSIGLLNGTTPYMQYIRSDMPYSLPNHFKKLGYETVALHPAPANNWNRSKVYPLMGFDSFINEDNMGEYQNENEFEYIRGYMSDRTSYSAVINQFENKNPDDRMFVFNITIQNHGGYSMQYGHFESDIEITNLNGKYEEAEQYLGLIKESDRAFEMLIDYFSDWDEPIIILMFGDHLPAVEDSFFEEIIGKPLDSLSSEEMLVRYRVPFVIWANYDIKSETGIKTSINYLSNILMEKAGLPKSEINMFLDGVRAEIPQINFMGHYDTDGVWQTNDIDKFTILDKYNNLSYYMLKHKK